MFLMNLIFISQVFGQDLMYQGKMVSLARLPSGKGWITPRCVDAKAKGRKPCDALMATKRATYQGLELGQDNPGDQVCELIVGGEAVNYVKSNRSETGFCHFSDGSVIDTDSLAWFAQENDFAKSTSKTK